MESKIFTISFGHHRWVLYVGICGLRLQTEDRSRSITPVELAALISQPEILPSVLHWVFKTRKEHRKNKAHIWVRTGMSGCKDYILDEVRTMCELQYPVRRARVHVSCANSLNQDFRVNWLDLVDMTHYLRNEEAYYPFTVSDLVRHALIGGPAELDFGDGCSPIIRTVDQDALVESNLVDGSRVSIPVLPERPKSCARKGARKADDDESAEE